MTRRNRRPFGERVLRAAGIHYLLPHLLLVRLTVLVMAVVGASFGFWAGLVLFENTDRRSLTPGWICEAIWLLLLATWFTRRATAHGNQRPHLPAMQSMLLRAEADRLDATSPSDTRKAFDVRIKRP